MVEETLVDGVTTSTYDAANRLLTADALSGITTYSYDQAGNRRSLEVPSGDITTYTWNGQNQLIQVELPDDEVVTYVWAPVNKNAEERIVTRDDGVDVQQLLWDNNNVVRETDDLDTVQAEYTYQPQPYGDLVSEHRNADSSFYRFDALGSTTGLTDAAGSTTDEYRYTAFGKESSVSGTNETPYRWVGELGYRQDDATGLNNLRARDYDPQAGRFVSEDPRDLEAGDSNFYRYLGNSPVDQTDPSGMWCWSCPVTSFVFSIGAPDTQTISAAPSNTFIGTYFLSQNVVTRTLIDNSRYQVPYSRLLRGLNAGEFRTNWDWREWDAWFRSNGTIVRIPQATSCGLNVATMSFSEKFIEALKIAYDQGLISAAAWEIVHELVQPENIALMAGIVATLASMGAAASAAGGASTALGGPAGAVGAGLAALLVGDLLIAWYLVKNELDNSDSCADLEAAAPTVAEFMAKLAINGALALIVKAVKGFLKKPKGVKNTTKASETESPLNKNDCPDLVSNPPSESANNLNLSKYDTLNIGSVGERPNSPNVLHVNIDPTALYEPVSGGVLIADGTNLSMLPSEHFIHVQANHIPGDATLAKGIISEGFRTLQSGGTGSFSSSSLAVIGKIMEEAGFINIRTSGAVPTLTGGPAIQYNGVKP